MALGGGAELWREAGTDRYYVREAVEDPMPSTSVRDLRRLRPIGRHQSRLVRTRVASCRSPWLSLSRVGEIVTVPISHGEGRFLAEAEVIRLYDQGHSDPEIARSIGCSQVAVFHWRKRTGRKANHRQGWARKGEKTNGNTQHDSG